MRGTETAKSFCIFVRQMTTGSADVAKWIGLVVAVAIAALITMLIYLLS